MKKANLLLTGGRGFLGSVIYRQLKEDYNFKLLGKNKLNDIICDLAKNVPSIEPSFKIIIHAAGRAHLVPKKEAEKKAFYQVNHQGTINLLKGLASCPELPKQFIFISTIAVYGVEEGKMIDETHPLNGKTPYAESKIWAEREIINWCQKNQVRYVILRLPLIVGKNAPGNLGAIRQAIKRGFYFSIKGNTARKSAVVAKDIATLIPNLEDKQGIYNLTDGTHPSFLEIETAIAQALGKKIPVSLPRPVVSGMSKIGDIFSWLGLPAPLTTNKLKKMTATLTFSDERAQHELGWQPGSVLEWLRNESHD